MENSEVLQQILHKLEQLEQAISGTGLLQSGEVETDDNDEVEFQADYPSCFPAPKHPVLETDNRAKTKTMIPWMEIAQSNSSFASRSPLELVNLLIDRCSHQGSEEQLELLIEIINEGSIFSMGSPDDLRKICHHATDLIGNQSNNAA